MMNALKSLAQWKGSIPQGGLLDFVLKVILALIVYFIGTKLIGWFCKKLRKQLMKFGSDEATKSFLLSGIKIGMHLILILTIAGNLGVDKTSVAALVGSAGVAISLALQGGLSNFAGGLIIMFLRPFSVGDYIIENGEKTEGTVQKIELYYTTLMTIDSRRIVIPNSVLTNDTARQIRSLLLRIRLSLIFPIAPICPSARMPITCTYARIIPSTVRNSRPCPIPRVSPWLQMYPAAFYPSR